MNTKIIKKNKKTRKIHKKKYKKFTKKGGSIFN